MRVYVNKRKELILAPDYFEKYGGVSNETIQIKDGEFTKEIENYYIHDMPLLKKNTLYNMYRTYMAEYQLKEDISKTKAQIMYCYGSKEMKCVKKSAQLFKELVPSCQIYEAKGYNHGYLAIYLPDEWLKVVVPFLNTKESL